MFFLLLQRSCVQLFNREDEIPIFTPNYIAILDTKLTEMAWLKILVVLRMWMAADKTANVHNLCGVVTERQPNRRISEILSSDDNNLAHSYILVLMFVLFTACFITKNFTHF